MRLPLVALACTAALACGDSSASAVEPAAASDAGSTREVGAITLVDRGSVSEGAAVTAPVLARWGDGLRLHYRKDGEPWSRSWLRDVGLLPEDRAPHKGSDYLFTGDLALETVARMVPGTEPPGSSPALANGVLRAGGEVVGWSPSLAWSPTGEAHLVYDRFDGADFDVVYRAPDGSERAVAATPSFEAHGSVAVDGRGHVWLAWDEGGEAWGRHGPLHESRAIRMAVLAEGKLHEGPPLPPLRDLLGGDETAADSRPRLAELPRLVADESGTIWLFYRVMTRWLDPEGEPESANRRVAWTIRALALTDAGWQGPVTLPASAGPNRDTLAVVPLPGGGVLAGYEADGRGQRIPNVRVWDAALARAPFVHAVELRVEGDAPEPSQIGAALAEPAAKPAAPPLERDRDPQLVPPGTRRLWGDLHRHTDQSRCKMDLDGTFLDQVRYAVEVADLDFLAVTDHFQHMTRDDWARERAATQRWNGVEGLLCLVGFERALPIGHWNLISADPDGAADGPFLPFQESRPWRGFDRDTWIAIPHQIADKSAPLRWNRSLGAFEPVAEIFQSRRGSYEERGGFRVDFGADPDAPHVVDHLAQGKQFGFSASSDHETSGHAFTAVLATERSRAGVMEALRARRTYAATARIALDVRLGELVMGASGAVAPDAELAVRVDVGEGHEIARVEVVRNGAVAHAWQGDPAGAGLLFLRLGRVKGEREAVLRFAGAEPGTPAPYAFEGGETLESTGGELRLTARLDVRDEDGLLEPLTFEDGATVELAIGDKTRTFTIDELRARPRDPFWLGQARCDLRLDPPALGGRRLERTWAPGDWKPGDVVYVRAVRADGELAWSSPIFVE